ncbi:hypothetical protein T440DRAFT_482948 [Plenodomus tracheiphilus IPT5]|uniref:RING-type domain-containing protein n=1 Tax=Plenodomus tracheiphilus IPT5 TaxID=1408161 RepID=A0A6A7ARH9_9PLEO|nr:hypothetical protein T440DRAFT_482948 [Plenodomus tracheiphilus IPT5]
MAPTLDEMSDDDKGEFGLKLFFELADLHGLLRDLDNLDMSGIIPFFQNAVTNLPDDYYTKHHQNCDICREVGEADVADDSIDLNTIALTAVVKVNHCGHVFHKACLHLWLKSQRINGRTGGGEKAGSCPKCRGVLIANKAHLPANMRPILNKLRTLVTRMNDQLSGVTGQHPTLGFIRNELDGVETQYRYHRTVLDTLQMEELDEEVFQVGPLFVDE